MPLLNVSVVGLANTSVVSLSLNVSVTFAVGAEFNRTVKVEVVPFSLTVALVPERTNPTVSLSVVVTVTLSDKPL